MRQNLGDDGDAEDYKRHGEERVDNATPEHIGPEPVVIQYIPHLHPLPGPRAHIQPTQRPAQHHRCAETPHIIPQQCAQPAAPRLHPLQPAAAGLCLLVLGADLGVEPTLLAVGERGKSDPHEQTRPQEIGGFEDGSVDRAWPACLGVGRVLAHQRPRHGGVLVIHSHEVLRRTYHTSHHPAAYKLGPLEPQNQADQLKLIGVVREQHKKQNNGKECHARAEQGNHGGNHQHPPHGVTELPKY
mmetsp:Transcript_18157/g.46492  ORF Transcript_18157/g.46492 Transcript_18157/m.46492 type:complete len:243 (-) Transcript_18157:565-1293(-)